MENLPTGPALPEHAKTFGEYWKFLCEETEWIRRRVLTLSFIDNMHVDYRVSLDLNAKKILAKKKELNLPFTDFLPVSLTLLAKGLQLDLDVKDSDNKACSVLTSDEGAFLGHAYFMNLLFSEGVFTPENIPQRVIDQSFDIINSRDGVNDLLDLLRAVRSYVHGEKHEASKRAMGELDIKAWILIIESAAYNRLFTLADSYYLSSYLSVQKSSEIIKYRRTSIYMEPQKHSVFNVQTLSSNRRILLQVNGIGSASRQHIRIDPPEGMGIRSSRLVGRTLERVHSGFDEFPSLISSVSDRKAVFYTKQAYEPSQKSKFFIDLKLYSLYHRFFLPATLCSTLVFSFSVTGLYLEHSACRFSGCPEILNVTTATVADPSASVALFGLLPTLFAVYITKSEHRFAARIHAFPRMLLVFSIFILIVCAWFIAIKVHHNLLITSFAFSSAVSIVSAVYFL